MPDFLVGVDPVLILYLLAASLVIPLHLLLEEQAVIALESDL